MTEGLLYLDSSALVKLVLPEAETEALLDELEDWPERVSSALAVVEVLRAARRASDSALIHRRARQVVQGIHLVPVDEEILDLAARLSPETLRSLDAIHVASALILGPDLGAVAAYDARLIEAATETGIPVLVPH